MAKSAFERLVRFEDAQGAVHYGEVPVSVPWDAELVGEEVETFAGDAPWAEEFTLTGKKAEIAKVLCPIPYAPVVIGVGLNYRKHAVEAGFPIPSYPVIFVKYADALAGPYEDIPINKECHNLDYEGELCVVIGKPCKNLSATDDPFSYILGYTTGNDVSSRYWQNAERAGNQHGYAKAFDKFAPIGPILVSPSLIPDPAKLQLSTKVNGVQKQKTGVDDLIFDVPAILRHLSRGTTLRPGTVIMTGTPSGVAAFEKPPGWLKSGDVVEVTVEGIGRIRNRMVFEE